MKLISELRRRNVFRMAALYLIAAWLIMQVADVVLDLAKLPDWIGQVILVLLAIGFPIALAFSWFYEITPEGISLEKDVEQAKSITHVTGRRLDFIVISILCAAVLVFAYDKWWTAPPPEKSIAVLAFENMSGDPNQEYFSDGISDELLNLLAQIPELTVISRSSAFSFKGKDVALPEIAEQLNVAHVLEGSVRRDGNQVRITAQLIEASSDSHLWSNSYDRDLDDVFAVQEEIASAIGDALELRLVMSTGGAKQPTVIRTASMDAYDAYLRGRELIYRREHLDEAIGHVEHSLRLDNNFAPAHAQLAIATGLLIYHADYNREEAWRIAIPHLERAQELAPDLAEAHGGRALLALFTGDPESTIEHARKALASNPNYSDAMNWLQSAFLDLGRYAESDATLKQMLVVDPLNIIGRFNYVERLSLTGRVDEAHDMADQLLAQSPRWGYQGHADTSLIWEGKIAEGLAWGLQLERELGGTSGKVSGALMWVGEYDEVRRISLEYSEWVDLYEGRFDEAIQVTQRNLHLNPHNEFVIVDAALFLYVAGRVDEALPHYERLREFVPEGRLIPGPFPVVQTMRLALARRKAGDEDGAQAAAQIARQDHLARSAAGRKNQEQDLAEAMIAAFEHDPDRAIGALKSAIQRGLRIHWFLDDSIFEDLRDEPRFVALQKKLDAILAEEHKKVLQLICFNNPTPDNWQPLPETCEGVVERRP